MHLCGHDRVLVTDSEGVICGRLGEDERGRREEGVRLEDYWRDIVSHW